MEWAREQFGQASLGDRRRTERGVCLAASLLTSADTGGTLPRALPQWKDLKAAYRWLSRPEVDHAAVLDHHCRHLGQACCQPGLFLMIEDTTTLDFTHRRHLRGLGPVGDHRGQGLLNHTTLAVEVLELPGPWAEAPAVLAGVPRGLLAQQLWRRDPQGPSEHDRWAAALADRACRPSGSHWLYVADRESDSLEVLQRCLKAQTGFLVRACQRRRLTDRPDTLQEAVAATEPLIGQRVEVPRRAGQKARHARVELRSCRVRLRATRTAAAVAVGVVEVREIDPPSTVKEPLHWVLLTSEPAETADEALRVVELYRQRWLIEDFHKILKAGLGIEGSQLRSAQAVGALLAVLSVVAVRLLELSRLAQHQPQRPAAEVVSGEVLAVLSARWGEPAGGWTAGRVVVAVARLGGHLARRGDGPPGILTLWRGWQRLMLLLEGYHLSPQNKGQCG